jgi:hypothetical protein
MLLRTTHSAIAWAHTSTPEEYEVITSWPGQSGKDCGKVPSDISYASSAASTSNLLSAYSLRPPSVVSIISPLTAVTASENPSWSPSPIDVRPAPNLFPSPPSPKQMFKWGFEVSPTDTRRISCIKILLDPSQPRPTFVNSKKLMLPAGRKPVDIVADYLAALRDHCRTTLSRRLGAEAAESTPIEYVLTVPAVWSDKARALTLEAAMRAGLGGTSGLRLITEPEGAAEYALRSLGPGSLKMGDCFTVCDAGGGTVDLITYTVSDLEPLRLDEVVVGTGALCGAVYLDRRFEEFVISVIGRQAWEEMGDRAKFQMISSWETHVKREFSEEGEDDFWVPVMGVSDTPDGRIRGAFLRITRYCSPLPPLASMSDQSSAMKSKPYSHQ